MHSYVHQLAFWAGGGARKKRLRHTTFNTNPHGGSSLSTNERKNWQTHLGQDSEIPLTIFVAFNSSNLCRHFRSYENETHLTFWFQRDRQFAGRSRWKTNIETTILIHADWAMSSRTVRCRSFLSHLFQVAHEFFSSQRLALFVHHSVEQLKFFGQVWQMFFHVPVPIFKFVPC